MHPQQMKASKGSLLAALTLLSSGCLTAAAANPTDSQSKTDASNCATDFMSVLRQKARPERLQDAQAFAQEWLRKRIAFCGASSYRESHIQGPQNSWDAVTEFLGFRFSVEPEEPTLADALNGIAFKGTLHLSANALRLYDSLSKKWNAPSNARVTIALPITNHNGLWNVDTTWFPYWQASNETTCETALKATGKQ